MAATGATLIPKALSLENLRERRASYEKEPLASQSGWGGASDVDTVSTVCVETPSPPSTPLTASRVWLSSRTLRSRAPPAQDFRHSITIRRAGYTHALIG